MESSTFNRSNYFKNLFTHQKFNLIFKLTRSNGLILIQYLPKIKQIISWYRRAVNKEITTHICAILRNVIISLSTIYPVEQTLVEYNFVFDGKDEADFFKKHLLIRDWARTRDIFTLGIKFHFQPCKN